MNWLNVIIVMLVLCGVFLTISAIKAGKGLDILVIFTVLVLVIIVWSFIQWISKNKLT